MSQAAAADRHKRSDAASYDEAAPEFDALTERYAAPLAERMLDLAQLGGAEAVLDAGTGTGLVALRAARRLRAGSVVGIDHSPGMLAVARGKAEAAGVAASFRQMDAEALAFPDRSFEAAVSLFMLYHLPDPPAALAELHRVLQPGGRLVLGVGRGPHLLSAAGVAAGFRRIGQEAAAARGRVLTAPEALRAVLGSLGLVGDRQPVARPRDLAIGAMLRRAGFTRVRTEWFGRRVVLDAAAFWSVSAVYGSQERTLLATLSEPRRAEVEAAFLSRCRAVQARGGSLIYPYGALFYVAERARSR